ncbi:MAG TPA: glycosyltransferase family 4 protein [Thermoanaerobaculaceae bacterium]|nr:glycosyltransferase family 4 protein [Thermoanaerobaculaceae bacterium]
MLDFVTACLADRGFEPVIAYYKPYSVDPRLSVPMYCLGWRRVGTRILTDRQGHEIHEIGSWLPELEVTHYAPTHHWRALIASCRHHIVVSGSCLAALPFAATGTTFLMWIATPWRADRRQREAHLSLGRRAFDMLVVRPLASRIERATLRKGTLLALSQYTRARLDGVAGRSVVRDVMPRPIETNTFFPYPARVSTLRLGFTGRLDDARKNIELLFRATWMCRQSGLEVTLTLVGGALPDRLWELAVRLGIRDCLEVLPFLPRHQLVPLLQSLDVFVIPSEQEGLCIAALEAMACGCPVVSTRCGGPEEFVVDEKTGYLCEPAPMEMSRKIQAIVRDRDLRSQLSRGARALVESKYSFAAAERIFWRAFDSTFVEERTCLQS